METNEKLLLLVRGLVGTVAAATMAEASNNMFLDILLEWLERAADLLREIDGKQPDEKYGGREYMDWMVEYRLDGAMPKDVPDFIRDFMIHAMREVTDPNNAKLQDKIDQFEGKIDIPVVFKDALEDIDADL